MKKNTLTKITPILLLCLLALCYMPLAILGFYGHPVGDDYYYALSTRSALENGGIFAALKAAAEGTALQYQIWQGTYSAMFFMHLPPQIFGDWAYRLYPAVHLAFFLGGLLTLCMAGEKQLGTTRSQTLSLFSLLGIFMLEGIPLAGESLYWYNGAMYYTGYFALSMYFFAGLLRLRKDSPLWQPALLFLLALFIGGGNYVSLLPLILLVFFYGLVLALKKESALLRRVVFIWSGLVMGLVISALAPGNAVRQAQAWKDNPIMAILKSFYWGLRYYGWWAGIPWILFMIALTVLILRILPNCKLTFRAPWLVIPVLFGIFCSMSTPTLYAEHSAGPARVFDLSYYAFWLLMAACWFYLLGALRKLGEGLQQSSSAFLTTLSEKSPLAIPLLLISLAFITARIILPFSETLHVPIPVRAAQALVSGEAADYAAQEKARMEVLSDPAVRDAVLEPFQVSDNLSGLLYVGDFGADAESENNQIFAAYFGKDSLRVDY